MKFLVIAAVTAVVVYFVVSTVKKVLYQNLVALMQNGSWKAFDQKVQSGLYRFFFSKGVLLDLQLNAAILQNNPQKIGKSFDQLLAMRLSPKSRDKLLMKAFNYYLSCSNRQKTGEYLKKIQETGNEAMIREARRAYHVYIEKSDVDLPELLAELEDMEDSQKGVHEFLISKIYENRRDSASAAKYRRLAEDHFALVDQQTAQKQKV